MFNYYNVSLFIPVFSMELLVPMPQEELILNIPMQNSLEKQVSLNCCFLKS